jgi:hypothetical protein
MIYTKINTLTTKVTAKELESIRLFKSRAMKLSTNSLIRDGYKLSVGLQLSMEDGHSFNIESLPSEEAFRSLLLEFRHFWMKRENCYFLRILKILDRYMPDVRNFTDELREIWNQALFGTINIMIDSNQLTPNTLIDLCLNAEYFHNDQSAKEKLDALHEMLQRDFVKSLLVGSVCQCCSAILILNGMLEKLDN